MTAAAAIMLGVLLLLTAAIGAFMVYERTESWRHSSVRKRALQVFAVLGPMFGGTVRPPEPEIPVLMAPLERQPRQR